MLQEREINRNYYLSSDTMEFEFRPLKDGGYQILSPQAAARQSLSRSHCPVLLSAQSRQSWHQRIRPALSQLTLVNLLERNTDELKEILERALGISFDQVYQFPIPAANTVSLLEDVPAALRECKSGILFFVRSCCAVDENTVEQWLKHRDTPDFLLELGGTLYRLGERQPIS